MKLKILALTVLTLGMAVTIGVTVRSAIGATEAIASQVRSILPSTAQLYSIQNKLLSR